eukprot:scaffold56988_cov32-Tisochrysis_lutea.AAC.3
MDVGLCMKAPPHAREVKRNRIDGPIYVSAGDGPACACELLEVHRQGLHRQSGVKDEIDA